MTSSSINSHMLLASGEAAQAIVPRWLSGAGKGYHRCSRCDAIVHVNNTSTRAHEESCWARPLLSISDECSFEYSSFASLSMDSESSAFERMDNAPSLAMNDTTVSFDIAELSDSDSHPDGQQAQPGEHASTASAAYTGEDIASFNCSMRQTVTNERAGLKPYTHSFSTEDSSAAIEWMGNELRNGGCFEIEDILTGAYVKAYFTAAYDRAESNGGEMIGILVHDTLTTLQTYGVDIASVKYITGVDEDNGLVYIILPDYCMANTNRLSFRYIHTIDSENDLLGFVKKGTPILTKDMCSLIEDAVEEYKRFDCNELLVRRFLYENKEKLINGGTFTIKDMEDAGIIDIYRNIYPEDSKNIKLGKTIGLYCDVKSKANSKVASNQRRKYGLKKDMIAYLSDC